MSRARRRSPSRRCALCETVMYGFDDDMELKPLGLKPEHPMACFSSASMCGSCFESWPQRPVYGKCRLDFVIENLESTTKAEVHQDEDCLLLLEVGVEASSWKPVEFKLTGSYTIELLLANTGTGIRLPLEKWGSEMPQKQNEKRLLKSEIAALEDVWQKLEELYPEGGDLLKEIDPESVVERHRVWLEKQARDHHG